MCNLMFVKEISRKKAQNAKITVMGCSSLLKGEGKEMGGRDGRERERQKSGVMVRGCGLASHKRLLLPAPASNS